MPRSAPPVCITVFFSFCNRFSYLQLFSPAKVHYALVHQCVWPSSATAQTRDDGVGFFPRRGISMKIAAAVYHIPPPCSGRELLPLCFSRHPQVMPECKQTINRHRLPRHFAQGHSRFTRQTARELAGVFAAHVLQLLDPSVISSCAAGLQSVWFPL